MKDHTSSISYDEELKNRILPHLSGTQSISQFVFSATEEKVRRLETKDERARIELLRRDVKVLGPIIREMKRRGEL